MNVQMQQIDLTESAPKAWAPKAWTLSKSGNVEAKFVFITTEMAQEVLLHQNTQNRRQSESLVRKYTTKMKEDRWHVTNQGIGFFRDGRFADGQHRLVAIVASGIGQTVLVVTGIDPEAAMAIDDLRARSEADRLRISGVDAEGLVGRNAVVRALHEVSLGSKARTRPLLTEELKEILALLDAELTFILEVMPRRGHGLSHSCARGALLAALLNGVDGDKVKRFCELVQTGTGATRPEGAAIRLREFLLTADTHGGSLARRDIFLRTQRALKAFLEGHAINKLYAAPELYWRCDDLFPVAKATEETPA